MGNVASLVPKRAKPLLAKRDRAIALIHRLEERDEGAADAVVHLAESLAATLRNK